MSLEFEAVPAFLEFLTNCQERYPRLRLKVIAYSKHGDPDTDSVEEEWLGDILLEELNQCLMESTRYSALLGLVEDIAGRVKEA